jgi:antitoxin FitA
MLPACYSKVMSFIQVKNVPDDLHEAVRRRAAIEGMTVSAYVLDLLRRDLALPSRQEWMARLATRQPVEVEAGVVLEAISADRRDELART